jgi:hypothetical protein
MLEEILVHLDNRKPLPPRTVMQAHKMCWLTRLYLLAWAAAERFSPSPSIDRLDTQAPSHLCFEE